VTHNLNQPSIYTEAHAAASAAQRLSANAHGFRNVWLVGDTECMVRRLVASEKWRRRFGLRKCIRSLCEPKLGTSMGCAALSS
jgi:hypothetical protein